MSLREAAIAGETADVILLDVPDEGSKALAALQRLLDVGERRRAQAFGVAAARLQFVAAHGLARRVLAHRHIEAMAKLEALSCHSPRKGARA